MVTFDILQISGQGTAFNLKADPYYYHSSSNNNFTFFCSYSAPKGNINFIFPDPECLYSIIQNNYYSGEELDLSLINSIQLNTINYSGEELNF